MSLSPIARTLVKSRGHYPIKGFSNLAVAPDAPKKRGRPPRHNAQPVEVTTQPVTSNKLKVTTPIPVENKSSLPPPSEWRKRFDTRSIAVRDRVSVSDGATAWAIANEFVPVNSRDKVVVEAYPGPGALTRALLKLPKSRIQKLIVLEDYEPYLEYLRPLAAMDPRLVVMPNPGWLWNTYQTLEDTGLLHPVTEIPWDAGIHPHLQFISHLPANVAGEQLIAQLFRGIPEKQWLFKYGRVPMSFVLSDYVWGRITAPIGDASRCKLSVIANAVAEVTKAVPSSVLAPYDDHFHPTNLKTVSGKPSERRRSGGPFQAVNIVPLETQVIQRGMLDKWDYCLRRLFVLKASPLKQAIGSLAPGAQVLLKAMTNPDLPESDRVDVKTQIRDLTISDWGALLKAFDKWPFAPEDLLITDAFSPKTERNT